MVEGDLPLVHASEAGKLDERPAGVTEVMSSYSVVSPRAHRVIQGFLVLGDDIHGVAYACGVEVGRGVVPAAAAAAAAAAVEVAIVAAVREGTAQQEGTGAEPGTAAAAVAVGHGGASPCQDM